MAKSEEERKALLEAKKKEGSTLNADGVHLGTLEFLKVRPGRNNIGSHTFSADMVPTSDKKEGKQ